MYTTGRTVWTERLKIACDACAIQLWIEWRKWKIWNMVLRFKFGIPFSVAKVHCRGTGVKNLTAQWLTDTQQHSHNSYHTHHSIHDTRLIATWRRMNVYVTVVHTSAISSAISSMRWERNVRHFRRFIWPRFAYNIERYKLSFVYELVDDLKNVELIALAVVMIFFRTFSIFYYIHESDGCTTHIFCVFFFHIRFQWTEWIVIGLQKKWNCNRNRNRNQKRSVRSTYSFMVNGHK